MSSAAQLPSQEARVQASRDISAAGLPAAIERQAAAGSCTTYHHRDSCMHIFFADMAWAAQYMLCPHVYARLESLEA